MPIQRPPLLNDKIYHIVVRGVGDSLIFKDVNDRYRAIFSIYEFNTSEPVEIKKQRERRKKEGEQFSDTRELLVDILAFCFMPNHIHLLIKQTVDEGITQFMRKFGAGYAAYFNKKYDRRGHLFQGRFRAVHIRSNEQLQTVFVYIHANPISLMESKWKERGIKNPKRIIKFLENYKWSSYQDYIGKKSFPSITERDFLNKVMGGEEGCREFVKNWVIYKEGIKGFSEVVLE